MSGRRFTLDTNILVYALDRQAGALHALAATIITRAVIMDCRLTLQSISEFFAVVTRKRLVPAAEAAAQARDWLDMFQTAAASDSAVRTALSTVAAGKASYWDALLLATAADAGCTTILTEDLADGSVIHGVRVLNPFAGSALTAMAEELLAPD